MKKIKKILTFSAIAIVITIIFGSICQVLFNWFWSFDILDRRSYQTLLSWWEEGGVFNTFRDCSLGVSLLLFPIICFGISYKLYKQGFWKTILSPFIKLYHACTRPKNMEVEHVSIKNLGVKDKPLEEIIADKIKQEKVESTANNASKTIRQQIAAKLEEN